MARRLAKEEGLLLGYSAGSAVAGLIQLKDQLQASDVVVVVIHDHGSRYVGKIYNDDWMRERGFLDDEMKVKDIVAQKPHTSFYAVDKTEGIRQAFHLMKQHDISQLPVLENEEVVGGLTESSVLQYLLENPGANGETTVGDIMGPAFPIIDENLPASQLTKFISKQIPAVIAKNRAGSMQIVTQYDLIQAM